MRRIENNRSEDANYFLKNIRKCFVLVNAALVTKSESGFNPFMPYGLFYFHSSDRSIFNIRVVWLNQFLLLQYFIEISVFNGNSVNTWSDLRLHCFLMALLWDTRHNWVKGDHCPVI